MPRGGPPILTDVRGPILVIPCEACERRGRYNVERLMARHGDAKLTDLFLGNVTARVASLLSRLA